MQKRTLYTPAKLKGLYEPLTEQAKPFSPVFGAAKYESGLIEEMYNTPLIEVPEIKMEEMTSMKVASRPEVKLVKELFYKQGIQFRPTQLKSSAAYSLTPNILGLVLGALGTDQLKDKAVYDDIIEQWRQESADITGDRKITLAKVKALIDLITEVYEKNPAECRAILLGFLYAKADPVSDHDMMHYFVSLNQYMPLFDAPVTSSLIQEPQKRAKQKSLSSQSLIMNVWNYISSYFAKKAEYKPEDYPTIFSNRVRYFSTTHTALKRQFEPVISTLINNKKSAGSFPPTVVMSSYGYQGQRARPDCFETALRDFLNIILYDPETKTFSMELLPPTVKLNDTLKTFYQTYKKIDQINSAQAGQAFMDLVSDVPSVIYSSGNYEVKSLADNFRILLNYLLAINAHTIEDIGRLLSTDTRTIKFSLTTVPLMLRSTITIDIVNKKTQAAAKIDLSFTGYHTELQMYGRTTLNVGDQVLNEDILRANHVTLKPEAQALLSLQHTIRDESRAEATMAVDYNKQFANNQEKEQYLEKLLDSNQSDEVVKYTHSLYGTLDDFLKVALFKHIARSGLYKKNEELRYIYKRIPIAAGFIRSEIFGIIVDNYDESDRETYNYIYKLAQDEPQAERSSFVRLDMLKAIIRSGLWKRDERFERYLLTFPLKDIIRDAFNTVEMSVDFVKKLYPKLPPKEQKRFLFEIMYYFKYKYFAPDPEHSFASDTYFSSPDLMVNIVKTLLLLGSDLTATDGYDTVFSILKEIQKDERQRDVRNPRVEENLKAIQQLLFDASSPTHAELLGVD